MKITLKKPLADHSRNILRRAGYAEHFDPRTQHASFSIRLGGGRYPRFHCYVDESDTSVTFNLHIDQKEASYEGSDHMHSGEYDGKLVEDELGRIRRWAGAPASGGSSTNVAHAPSQGIGQERGPALPTSKPPKKPGLFQRMFGGRSDDED